MRRSGFPSARRLPFAGIASSEKLSQIYACLYGIHGQAGRLTRCRTELADPFPMPSITLGMGQLVLSILLLFLFLLAVRSLPHPLAPLRPPRMVAKARNRRVGRPAAAALQPAYERRQPAAPPDYEVMLAGGGWCVRLRRSFIRRMLGGFSGTASAAPGKLRRHLPAVAPGFCGHHDRLSPTIWPKRHQRSC
ncbi:MAG: hypothetical protein U1E38_02540 [Rhodospirillales bacterium]